jgi:hypothetical protein
MEDMYNVPDQMQMHSCCPMMTCPMMCMQPMNINPMIMRQMPSCMNLLQNNVYGVPLNWQQGYMQGAIPMRGNMGNPYLFQAEMRPVPVEEIKE